MTHGFTSRAACVVALVVASSAIGVGGGVDARQVDRDLRPASRLGPQTQVAAPPPPPLGPVLFVSDSSFAGIRWTGNLHLLQGAPIDARLESCRRLTWVSCRGREGYAPPTAGEEVRSVPFDAYQVLVVGTGYNDFRSMFAQGFTEVMTASRARGIDRVVWITYREQVNYTSPSNASNAATFAANNRYLRDQVASGAWPELVLADWHHYSFGRWSWVTSDGVHFTPTGAQAAAIYVSRVLAHVGGRPCPLGIGGPSTSDGICADPDVTGPP